jgi:hypothetical protein
MVKSVIVAEPNAKEKTVTALPPSMITPLPRMVREELGDVKLVPIAGRGLPVKLIICPAMGEQSMTSPSSAE